LRRDIVVFMPDIECNTPPALTLLQLRPAVVKEAAMSLRFGPVGLATALSVCALAAPHRASAEDTPIASGQQTNGKARAEILSLKRTEADTLTLRFAIANEDNRDLSITISNMQLVDLVNRRTYKPGLESNSCRIPAGERRICWAVFAAPNASVRMLNVKFYEDFDLIPVQISGAN